MDRLEIFLLVLLSMQTIKFSSCSIDSKAVCIKRERQALLHFKQGLKDPYNWLSSWTGEDCCKWKGVVCNNKTGHVLSLNPSLVEGGDISPSLLELKHLRHLDLSSNYFNGICIPEFFGSLKNLRYLNLAFAGFAGMVPQQLGNLSRLRYLDLSGNDYGLNGGGLVGLHVESFRWLSHLSFLRHLDMGQVDLSKVSDYLQMMNMLPSLSMLRLSSCSLGEIPALPIPYVNFTSLTVIDLSWNNFNSLFPDWLMSSSGLVSLDLSYSYFQGPIPDTLQNMTSLRVLDLSSNNFNSTIPDWLYNCGSLVSLDLSDNNLQGTISSAIDNLTSLTSLDMSENELTGGIPTTLGNLCHLQGLDIHNNKLQGEINGFLGSFSGCIANSSLEMLNLAENQLSGTIPASLGRFTSLRYLNVAGNQLKGNIPESLGCMSELMRLYIHSNSLEGVVSEVHFANLTRLEILDASSNSLVLKVRSDWIPPFQLQEILLGSWRLGPQFPAWIRTQKNFSTLNLSRTGILDKIPTWFWNTSSQLFALDLSQNQIHGEFPRVLNFDGPYFKVINLESNRFNGPLPYFFSKAKALYLSNNSFSGSVSHFLCQKMDEPCNLQVLDLSYNLLSGELPECWMNCQELAAIQFRNNNFTGKIPSSMGSLYFLESLNLHNNSLSGELPPSLQNCTNLMFIDLGENKLSGGIPTWIGKSLTNLLVLNLRSNSFSGIIPPKQCNLISLQVLDLANNNLSGTIPQCFSNFSAMAKTKNSSDSIYYFTNSSDFVDKTSLVIKGREWEYGNILKLLVSMDLSVNHLSGEIPQELATLSRLRSLNLSGNDLRGKIPGKIGDMVFLESLDLSMNKLSGEIPQSMSNLTFLSILNLSYNRFSGKIPLSTQLQSFNTASFIGNLQLCGPPLMERCNEDDTSNGPMPGHNGEEDRGGQDFEAKWFYSSMAFGFVLGFWGIFGPLLFNKSWRVSYFLILSNMKDKILYHLI